MRRIPLLTTISLFLFSNTVNAHLEPEMIQVPGGCTEIGTLLMDQQFSPLREVCLDDFMIGKYEVTFNEYDLFTEETGRALRHDVGYGRGNRPVVDVNWFDAVAYAEWLSAKTGKTYRLPTDAEWEYAAKFNTEFGSVYSWGTEIGHEQANCRRCGSEWDSEMTAPVGSFEPNPLGIHDMHGNVWEWTSNCFFDDAEKNVNDMHCEVGVVRGGSWDSGSSDLVLWRRTPQSSTRPARDIGFRLVLQP